MSPPQHLSHWPSWPLPVLPLDVQTTPRHACTYLPDRWATFRAFDADTPLPADLYQRLLDAGFRRSGSIIYQPMCARCRACVPLRIPIGGFQPSKSQRRVLHKNADLVVSTRDPEATSEKWDLYDRYQRQWHHHRAADAEEVLEFVAFLYRSPVPCVEFEYRDPWGTLLGVGLCDLCPASLSSVYFYFDPRHARRCLGTFSALYEIQWARAQNLRHWYAGYWIEHCPAMSYKSRFRPCEALGTDGHWRALHDSHVDAPPP
jgi:leucyl-tRNA---protein transferase